MQKRIFYKNKFNWQIQKPEVSTLWGLPDTVREVMNNNTPVTYSVGYSGSNYVNASSEELTYILNALFNFRTDDGSFPYRNIVSPDLCVVSENECIEPRDKDNYPIEYYA